MKHTFGFMIAWLFPCLVIGGETALLVPSVHMQDRHGLPMRGFLSAQQTYYRPVALGDMSPWIIAAVVAAEDQRFFVHDGVDSQAVLRAAWQNTKDGKIASGASTITQQLVRTLRPHPKTWRAKLGEAWQAVRMEQTQSKEEILETYLNVLELGNLTQGVEAASLYYFGVNARDVSIAQAALLAALAKSPTYYNPLIYPKRAEKRRNYVLARMRDEQFINEELYTMALAEPVVLAARPRPFAAPHFTYLLRSLLPAGAADVHTTLDREVQLFARQIIQSQLRLLAGQNVTNAAAVVLENKTGEVLAYIGSADFNDTLHQGQVDGARALRQPGSALKPFVYALALEEHKLTPASLLNDEDTFFEGGFRPRNYDEKFHGWISLRQALACSYNVPAVKAAELVGTAAVLERLRKAGLTTLSKDADFYGLGIALGNGEVKLWELTNAYASLARGGEYLPLVLASIPRVELGESRHRVFSPQTAALITDILKDNQARSAAFGLNSPLTANFEVAAKTGTSKDYKDNFTFMYTPRWTVGVWVGNFDATPMQKVSGISGAGPIAHDIAVFMQTKYPSEPFKEPNGLVHRRICTDSGFLAGGKCSHTREEVFMDKYVPRRCSGVHTKAQPACTLLTPKEDDVYKLDPAVTPSSQSLVFSAACAEKSCHWRIDGKKIQARTCSTVWPLQPGKHQVEVACGKQKATASFEVLP